MSIFDVRFQPLAQGLLQQAVHCGRIPHAYIFDGPDGVGREMLALRFVRLLFCEAPVAPGDRPPEYDAAASQWIDGCGQCAGCSLMASESHPDCHLVYRQLNKFHDDADVRNRKATRIGIDVIRKFVIEAASRKGTVHRRKAFIIQEAELMTTESQNALLKTLEEPPEDTYIILLVTRLSALLPTTLSRCQLVRFRSLPTEFVAQRLRELRSELDDESVQFLARHEPGSLGRAVQLADDGFYACNRELVEGLLQLSRTSTLGLAERINQYATELGKKLKTRQPESSDSDVNRRALGTLLDLVATFYRDVLRGACGDRDSLCNRHAADPIFRLGGRWGAGRAADAITHVGLAQRDAVANANGLLCLEGLLIKLARLQ